MRKKLIYIADDEINICSIIKSFLEKEGFQVETFTDGQAGLTAFQEKEPDMLILDIMMPEMDGYSVCSCVRQKSSVPIIFVSAKDTEPDKIAGLMLGSDDLGLGLAISRSIIEWHNGKLLARNLDTGGALFIIELPV